MWLSKKMRFSKTLLNKKKDKLKMLIIQSNTTEALIKLVTRVKKLVTNKILRKSLMTTFKWMMRKKIKTCRKSLLLQSVNSPFHQLKLSSRMTKGSFSNLKQGVTVQKKTIIKEFLRIHIRSKKLLLLKRTKLLMGQLMIVFQVEELHLEQLMLLKKIWKEVLLSLKLLR